MPQKKMSKLILFQKLKTEIVFKSLYAWFCKTSSKKQTKQKSVMHLIQITGWKREWMTAQNTSTALAWERIMKTHSWHKWKFLSFLQRVGLFWDGIYNLTLISQSDYSWDWWKHRWLVSTYVWEILSVGLVCLWGSTACASLEGSLMCVRGSDPVIFR